MLQVYRLVHELCEMGSDAYAWRSRMLSELRRMVNADMGIAYGLQFPFDPAAIGPKILINIRQQLDESWDNYIDIGDLTRDPMTPHIMQRIGTDFTMTRHEVISDDEWYASSFYGEVASVANWDQCIYSQVYVPSPGVVHGLGIGRAVGKPPFSEAEVAIVDCLHAELARLWRRPDPLDVHNLPRRQRETLEGIRRGFARKTIAENMGVSASTVHSYEKALFERVGVSGRGELLAAMSSIIRPNLLL